METKPGFDLRNPKSVCQNCGEFRQVEITFHKNSESRLLWVENVSRTTGDLSCLFPALHDTSALPKTPLESSTSFSPQRPNCSAFQRNHPIILSPETRQGRCKGNECLGSTVISSAPDERSLPATTWHSRALSISFVKSLKPTEVFLFLFLDAS